MLDYIRDPIASSGEKYDKIVVLLHGYGASAEDLLGAKEYIGDIIENALFIAPNALEECEIYSQGYQWFSLEDIYIYEENIDDSKLLLIKDRIDNAVNKLTDFLSQILSQFNKEWEDLVIVGFSQGAFLGLQTILSYNKTIHAIIGLSGFYCEELIPQHENIVMQHICLLHGAEDKVVSCKVIPKIEPALQNNHLVFSKIIPSLEHNINYDTIGYIQSFLLSLQQMKDENLEDEENSE